MANLRGFGKGLAKMSVLCYGASMNLSHIKTRDQLRAEVESFQGCPLRSCANKTVFSGGNPKAEVMLIGEAPGAQEDGAGEPFVGRSGQLLIKLFTNIGLPRDKLYITNMTFWRPPENRTPTKKELATTHHLVEKHIEIMAPKVLVLVGNVPTQTLLNTKTGISKLHGEWQEFTTPNLTNPIATMPLYHPAFLLRNNKKTPEMEADLLLIKQKLNEG